MKHKISKAAAALAVATAAVFAAPAVANAYTPSPVVESSPGTIAPGGTGTITFADFEPNEGVQFTLTGENGAGATLAFVSFAVSSTSTTKAADADGNASVEVTLPTNASGEYTLSAVGLESGTSASTTFGVAAAAGGDSDGGSAGGPALGDTGFDGDALLGLWVGGGVLVLAGASIAVATSVRRTRRA